MSARLIGAIVRDATVDDGSARYAVGRRGYFSFDDASWSYYDSGVGGPDFFDRPEFVVEESDR